MSSTMAHTVCCLLLSECASGGLRIYSSGLWTDAGPGRCCVQGYTCGWSLLCVQLQASTSADITCAVLSRGPDNSATTNSPTSIALLDAFAKPYPARLPSSKAPLSRGSCMSTKGTPWRRVSAREPSSQRPAEQRRMPRDLYKKGVRRRRRGQGGR